MAKDKAVEVVDEVKDFTASIKIVQKPKVKGGGYGEPNFIRLVEYKEKVTTSELVKDLVNQINGIVRICESVALHNLPMRGFLKIKKGSDLFFTIVINEETIVSTTTTPMQLAQKGSFLDEDRLLLLATHTVALASNTFASKIV